MAYKINIGTESPTRNIYIIPEGVTGLSSFSPTEVTGSANVAQLNFDSDDKDIFTAFIKQSLTISLIRENETDFQDIISGNDENTYAVVVYNGTLSLSGGELVLSEGARLDFIGTLTMETYGEQFIDNAEVTLTFHDRIGFLDDQEFEPVRTRLSIVEFMAECLPSISCSRYVLVEWAFSDSTYSRPDQFYYDFAPFYGEKKKEVLEQFLKDHAMQLVVDFTKIYDSSSTPALIECGCIVIRMPGQFADTTNDFYLLKRVDTVFGTKLVYSYELQTSTVTITTSDVYPEFSLVYYGGGYATFVLSMLGSGYMVIFDTAPPDPLREGEIWVDTSVHPNHTEYAAMIEAGITGFSTYYDDLSTGSVVKWRAKTASADYNMTVTTVPIPPVLYTIILTDYTTGVVTIDPSSYVYEITPERNTLNSSSTPLIERAAGWELLRKAKYIKAKHDLSVQENLIFKGTVDEDEISVTYVNDTPSNSTYKHCRYILSDSSTLAKDLINYVNETMVSTGYQQAFISYYDGNPYVEINAFTYALSTKYPMVFSPVYLYNGSSTMNFTLTGKCSVDDTDIYLIFITKDGNGNLQYYDGSNWLNLTSLFDYTTITPNNIDIGDIEISTSITLLATNGLTIYPVVLAKTNGITSGTIYISSYVALLDVDESYPKTISLNTMLNELNRKSVALSVRFGTTPNLIGAAMYYRNVISNVDGYADTTLTFETLDQTLLAHLSDIYGLNYQEDRWYLSAKTKNNSFALYGTFELTTRILMLVEGDLDLKRGVLNGRFAEVVYDGYAECWQWDDGDPLAWDDGDYILIG